MATRPLTLVCAAKLFGNLLERYLEPLDRCPEVGRIIVVRHEPIGSRLKKVENVSFGSGHPLPGMARMFGALEKTLRENAVDWVMGFNPVPWGALGALAGRLHGVRTSLSFIGMDYKQIARPAALPIWLLVKRAELVTVTGERMRQGLVARGLPAERVRILPHFVDTARFAPGDAEPDLDIVSVGQLIHRKRLDVVIDAVARLRDRGILLRAGIVGGGPLKEELERRIAERNVADRVKLFGFVDDVEAFLKRARLFALVSEWEGVPFAMIEAMCAGLVPIVTDVGTISDFIQDGRNGHIVPVGDAGALADTLERLVGDPAHYDTLRQAALRLRAELSLDRGVEFWRNELCR